MANKTQAGRGSTTITTIPLVPTLDIRALALGQLSAAADVFDHLKSQRLLPLDQIDQDPVRAELDRHLLTDVLGADSGISAAGGPLELLRRKIGREPQIHGGKQTKIVFTQEGEERVDR